MKYYRDWNDVIETSRKEGEVSGLEQGIEIGLEQGREKRSAEIARSLLSKLSVESISEAAGLSIDEIERLGGLGLLCKAVSKESRSARRVRD